MASRMTFQKGRDLPVYLLILPAFALLAVFHYVPLYGIVIAFQDFSPYRGIAGSSWIGWANFRYFLLDDNFWRVMRNTIAINLYNIIFGFPFPIVFALLLNEVRGVAFKKTVQTISYLPYFISWVVVAGIVASVFNPDTGIVNKALHGLFGMDPVFFMAKKECFRAIVVGSSIWKDFGIGAVYYIAAIAGIDTQLYEAAVIDGAGRWRQTLAITLPGIRSMVIILLVLRVGSIVNIGFEQIFLLYNPLVYEVGDVISTYTYRLGIEQTRFSLTTAIGVTQSIVNFILVYSANRISRKVAGWSLW